VCKSPVVSLFALLASAVLAMVLAAQTSLACTDKVAVPMTGDMMNSMPGMDMAASGPVMVCPVVLVLIVLSAFLSACAVAMLWRDPHRVLAQREIVRKLARLPLARTVGMLAFAGASAVGTMILLERSGLPAPPMCALLAALLFGCALVATLGAIAFGRVAGALGRRLMLAIARAIAVANDALAPCFQRRLPFVAARNAVPPLALGRGLRAPPIFVQ
jgi:hypothetical protein